MPKAPSKKSPLVLTIGHSTRSLEDFKNILKAHSVALVVDVRTVPRSSHNPQFNRDTLPGKLKEAGIKYLHFPKLGGLRMAAKDSGNTGWRKASFRGFADYMQTDGFKQGVEEIAGLAKKELLALLCAEALPWRCHRSLIADALYVRNIRVAHIISSSHASPHELTPFARVWGRRITYPPSPFTEGEEKNTVKPEK